MHKLLPLTLLFFAAAQAAPIRKDVIAENFKDAMSITLATDGDVYLVEREGGIFRIRPETGGVFQIGDLPVSALRESDPKSDTAVEDGLQAILLDPNFATNPRLLLYYSHPQILANRLAWFTLRDGKVDLGSETVVLDIPSERSDRVCHHGGSMAFGPDGLLYLSVGDNTNPFESDGFAPIDNRPGRTPWDAQRSAGNTNDLRGKILRIRLTENGYEIPPGNLFPPGTEKTRPEIYVMGCRNPFRISVDPKNSTLYWGEVGPDADKEDAKGPAGHDEINQAKAAGNFGWPFFVANNKPYATVDFATGNVGKLADPAGPVNTGIRNTGLTKLPPAQSAFIWYRYDDTPDFPIMGKGGRNAMAGPVFYYDAERKYNFFPQEKDHSLIFYDWMRSKIWTGKLGDDEKLMGIETEVEGLQHPMDLEMAKDGALWLIDYGSEWWFNKKSSVLRLLPPETNQSPTLEIEPVAGSKNTFKVKSSADPEGDPVTITWWLSQGVQETKLGNSSTVTLPAEGGTELRAVASDGKSSNTVARISLIEKASIPTLKISLAENPESLGFGETITYNVTSATLPPAAQVSVRARFIPATGHDAGGPQFTTALNELATANQCLACHQVDHSSVGPKYLDIALKYRTRSDAVDYLKSKLKTGGGGVWGAIPMPPQVALKDADSDTLVRAILSLADGISEVKGSLAGSMKLAPKPTDEDGGGAWEISAEAPGYASAKFRVPTK